MVDDGMYVYENFARTYTSSPINYTNLRGKRR